MQTVDAILTYTAAALLFGSFVYFPTMFIVFVVKSESEKAQHLRMSGLEAEIKEIKADLAEIKPNIEVTANQNNLETCNSVESEELEPEEGTIVDTTESVTSGSGYAASQIEEQSFSLTISATGDEKQSEPEPEKLLPVIERAALTIWSGRKQLQLVPVNSLPFSVPGHIKRRRWRNQDAIAFSDLEKIAQII